MPTSDALTASLRAHDDPRLKEGFWRVLDGGDGTQPVVLVGVVHDHPASSYRVGAVARAADPDVLALELPQLSVPAFEQTAAEREAGAGGEMTAAIAATDQSRVVGIDSLGWRFALRFCQTARRNGATISTLRAAASEVATIARDALGHRFRQDPAGAAETGAHNVSDSDDPTVQASDEQTQVARSRSLLGAIERPEADLLVDETREQTMAAEIARRRQSESVLAVVGMDHLDSIAAQLA